MYVVIAHIILCELRFHHSFFQDITEIIFWITEISKILQKKLTLRNLISRNPHEGFRDLRELWKSTLLWGLITPSTAYGPYVNNSPPNASSWRWYQETKIILFITKIKDRVVSALPFEIILQQWTFSEHTEKLNFLFWCFHIKTRHLWCFLKEGNDA